MWIAYVRISREPCGVETRRGKLSGVLGIVSRKSFQKRSIELAKFGSEGGPYPQRQVRQIGIKNQPANLGQIRTLLCRIYLSPNSSRSALRQAIVPWFIRSCANPPVIKTQDIHRSTCERSYRRASRWRVSTELRHTDQLNSPGGPRVKSPLTCQPSHVATDGLPQRNWLRHRINGFQLLDVCQPQHRSKGSFLSTETSDVIWALACRFQS